MDASALLLPGHPVQPLRPAQACQRACRFGEVGIAEHGDFIIGNCPLRVAITSAERGRYGEYRIVFRLNAPDALTGDAEPRGETFVERYQGQ